MRPSSSSSTSLAESGATVPVAVPLHVDREPLTETGSLQYALYSCWPWSVWISPNAREALSGAGFGGSRPSAK